MKYTITGATGNLGSRVISELVGLVKPIEIRAAVHTPAKATGLIKFGIEVVKMDYQDITSMIKAFTGTSVLVYIPSKTYNILQRITEFENTLAAMKQANVHRIIFVSFFADQETNPFTMSAYYGYVPRRLAASNLAYTIVKNSLYADPLIPYLPELIDRKNIIYPVGNQALAFITQKNSAEAIAQLATHPKLRDKGQSYLLSMAKSYQMEKLAKIMTKVTAKPIGYSPVTLKEFAKIYHAEGDGNELASMYEAGALGLLNATSTDFEIITGHQPQTMKSFLVENFKA